MKRPAEDPVVFDEEEGGAASSLGPGYLTHVSVNELRRLLFPRSAKNPRRALFPPDQNLSEFLEEELRLVREEERSKWNFDFEKMEPLPEADGAGFEWTRETVHFPSREEAARFEEPDLGELIRSHVGDLGMEEGEEVSPTTGTSRSGESSSTPPAAPPPDERTRRLHSSITDHLSLRRRPSTSSASPPPEKRTPPRES